MAGKISTTGVATAVASAVAVLFSAISLYQTVLKRPDLRVYVSPIAHYTRDNEAGAEVFAIPVTVANRGARAGTVLSVELDVENVKSGEFRTFHGTYQVDGDFFVGSAEYDWQSKRMKKLVRPKSPFTPISVAGQEAFSSTLLFYPLKPQSSKLVTEKGDFVLTMRMKTQFDDGANFDLFGPGAPEPVTFKMALPFYNRYTPMNGGSLRLVGQDLLTPRVRAVGEISVDDDKKNVRGAISAGGAAATTGGETSGRGAVESPAGEISVVEDETPTTGGISSEGEGADSVEISD